MSTCPQCAHLTVWDDELGSAVCTVCGTLVDAAQSALTSHLNNHDNSARQYDRLAIPLASTLKSIHSRHGWNLAGQGKEARDTKNNYAIHEFIRSISSNLSAPGVSARAVNIFSQAMAMGKYHWGRKAKLTAAAAVAIALRESHRSDSLRDIAFLVDEPPLALSRAFISILNILKISLTSADPATHFPVLCSYLSTFLNSPPPPSPLSRPLIAFLTPLSLSAVTQTAHGLSTLLSRLGHISLTSLPTPPTACALFILALESEARTCIPSLDDLAQHLGGRVGAGKKAVMSRYRLVYGLVEEWSRELPWLDRFAPKNGRSKLAKRIIVARGMKDVLCFQEDIWRKKLETLTRPTVTLDRDESADDNGSDLDETIHIIRPGSSGPHKKGKRHGLAAASSFLLNPLCTDFRPSGSADSFPMISYLLTAEDSSLSLHTSPTRLQRLAAERGGESEIPDDELLEEGEWEAMMRSKEEQDALRDVLDWETNQPDSSGNKSGAAAERKRDEGMCFQEGQWRSRTDVYTSGRINMEAFSKLQRDIEAYDGKEDCRHFDLDYGLLDDSGLGEQIKQSPDEDALQLEESSNRTVDNDEVVESWRPLSPDHSIGFAVEDRYDEEY